MTVGMMIPNALGYCKVLGSIARCVLYVALSQAKNRLMLVVSGNNPSPLRRV